jgi:hypothetical protein
VRYADDGNICVRGKEPGRRVTATLTRFIEGRLKLQIISVGYIIPPTLDDPQCAVLSEYHGGRFCMLLVGFSIGGRDSRNESIDIGHDASPPV